MTTDGIEELIKEIATEHGIAVGRDDPILILQTVNNRLIQESTAAQRELSDRLKNDLEEIARKWGDDAKDKAERTLNAALTAGRNVVTTAIREEGRAVSATLRREIEEIADRLNARIIEARRTAIMNLIAAGMTVFAAGLVLWAVL